MFTIGDLVRFKKSNIQRDRLNPNKKFGVIVSIKKDAVKSLWGKKEDVVVVRWLPWDKDENVMSFYLEHMEKECENKK